MVIGKKVKFVYFKHYLHTPYKSNSFYQILLYFVVKCGKSMLDISKHLTSLPSLSDLLGIISKLLSPQLLFNTSIGGYLSQFLDVQNDLLLL